MSLALLVLGILALLGVVNAVHPTRIWFLMGISWPAAWVTVELAPHLVVLGTAAAALLVAGGALDETAGWVGLALLLAADACAIPLILRARRTAVEIGPVVEELGDLPEPAAPYPRHHILLPFLAWRRRGVRRVNGIEYARHGRKRLKLDVYLPAGRAPGERSPAIVQVHGGAWIVGTRREQGVPLLGHLAANGWVGFNIDYRLSPRATFPEHLEDVKAAIAWVREHADEYGVDTSFIALTGGSAGGHLAALAALTAEDEATSVDACVPFYGVYDMVDAQGRHHPVLQHILERIVFKARRSEAPELFAQASPSERVHPGAPPFYVIHGTHDSLVPVEEARCFVERLQETSEAPVLYAEMKGGQHAFDVIPSWRTIPVIESIERFLAAQRGAARERSSRAPEREGIRVDG